MEAHSWLERHGFELELKETSEEEKQAYAFQTSWPVLPKVHSFGKFSQITTNANFDCVIGDPVNWKTIRTDTFLFEEWVLPNAILLFGKSWFDKMKWAPSVSRGGEFPLFSDQDKQAARKEEKPLEETPAGKARISQIIEIVSHSLKVYVRANWYDGSYVKRPSGYIINSIKNDLTRDIAGDMGFKMVQRSACPGCLARGKKTLVTRHSDHEVSCEVCKETARNIKLNVKRHFQNKEFDAAAALYKKLLPLERFVEFTPLIAVCPNPECHGKFVPTSCVDYGCEKDVALKFDRYLSTITPPKSTQTTIDCPKSIRLPLVCPHCDHKFVPKTFTGLPTIGVWKKPTKSINEPNNGVDLESVLVCSEEDIQERIANKQRLNVLIDELIIKLASNTKTSASSLTTWYFCLAAVQWIRENPQDAVKYFFDVESPSSKELAVHQNIFHIWMDLLEANVCEFRKFGIKSLSDFGWLCREPKFSGGPKSMFRSVVESNKIANRTKVREVGSDAIPRIARLLAVHKVIDGRVDTSYNFSHDVKHVEWQGVILDPSSDLKDGDRVRMSVLLMSGHCTNAPIQRILRLKSKILGHVIDKILLEEKGNTFQDFWLSRSNLVREAYDKLGGLIEGEKNGR